MISKTGFKRLYRLCDYMASLPRSAVKHFNMQHFYEHQGEGHDHQLPVAPKVGDLHACGTTACALGWAMTVPSFRRAGLRIEESERFFEGESADYFVCGSEEVFGLDEDSYEWEQLFGGDNTDKSPKAWAKRVRRLLREWQKHDGR